MFNSILVICTGNICRSPIAEELLRTLLPGRKVNSAGTGALVNKGADASATKIALKYGLSLDLHRAQQFTNVLARDYDLILVMEKEHQEYIMRHAPEASGKTMLLGHWLGSKEIPDPYRKSDEAFESVYQLIHSSCQQWVAKLNR